MSAIDWSLAGSWYDRNAEAFEASTLRRDPSDLIVDFARRLPPGGRVLDAGCGVGRDMQWLAAAGFDVAGFDLSARMVEAARRNTGYRHPVRRMDFQSYDDRRGRWDGIWAMASLLHLPKSALGPVLEKLFESLSSGGVLAFNVKAGDSEAIDDRGRPMSQYGADEIRDIVLSSLVDVRARVDISISTAADSSGRRTSWIAATIDRGDPPT